MYAVMRDTSKNSGGNGEGEPPVPIPNTEVKPTDADGSAFRKCVRVSNRQNLNIYFDKWGISSAGRAAPF